MKAKTDAEEQAAPPIPDETKEEFLHLKDVLIEEIKDLLPSAKKYVNFTTKTALCKSNRNLNPIFCVNHVSIIS